MMPLNTLVVVVMFVYALAQYLRGDYVWMTIDLALASGLIIVTALSFYLTYEKPNPNDIDIRPSTDW